jgi:hypothetical protein
MGMMYEYDAWMKQSPAFAAELTGVSCEKHIMRGLESVDANVASRMGTIPIPAPIKEVSNHEQV